MKESRQNMSERESSPKFGRERQRSTENDKTLQSVYVTFLHETFTSQTRKRSQILILNCV